MCPAPIPIGTRAADTSIRFFKGLLEIGLGTYKRGIRGTLGMFFFRKKGGRQRMVIDARGPNAMHQRSPATELRTPGVVASLDLMGDDKGLQASPEYYASAVGLVDSFYQSEDDDLSPRF